MKLCHGSGLLNTHPNLYLGALLVLFLLWLTCSCVNTTKEECDRDILIKGAFALYPLISQWTYEYEVSHPGMKFHVTPASSTLAEVATLWAQTDLGMFSKQLVDSLEKNNLWTISVAMDAVLPVINRQNLWADSLIRTGVTLDVLRNIYIHENMQRWSECESAGDAARIRLYTRSDLSGAGNVWASYLGVRQSDLAGWGVYGDPGMTNAVKNNPSALGYLNLKYIFDPGTGKPFEWLTVLPIDFNGNGLIDKEEDVFSSLENFQGAAMQGFIPSPPLRQLYLIAHHRPDDPCLLGFLEWIFSQGNKSVLEFGYVPLPQEMFEKEFNKLNKQP